MKKTILIVLLVLLAFTLWSVLTFGKAKRSEEVQPPSEIQKAEPGPAPEDFPAVVLPKAHPVHPTEEVYQNMLMEKKNRTPEQMKALQGEAVPIEQESRSAKAPYFCEVRNQVGGAAYYPGGDADLYCWGDLGLATLLNLDHNYWTDCPYPLYPFEITDLAVQVYAGDTCTIWSSGRIYDVDYSTGCQYPNAQICPPGGPKMDNHPGGFLWIDVPMPETCCVYNEFFAAWMFDNSDDYNDTDYCTPIYFVPLSLIFDVSGRPCQSYWGPYAEYTGEPYYGWFDVVTNGIWSGALRIEVLGYTADQNECPPPPETWYYKEGMPDFYQYNEAFPDSGKAYCGPTAGANSIWWFACVEEDFPPSWGGCVEGVDDIALINEIAAASGTDPVLGTNCDLLQEGIINTIKAHGGWWFYDNNMYNPDFWWIQKELRDCEDVILLLAFVQTPDSITWYTFGGHFVTLAGVDIYSLPTKIAISDPATTPSGYAIYDVAWPSLSPCGYLYLPDYYANWPDFDAQNLYPCTTLIPYAPYNPALPVFVEVPQAIAFSPGSKFLTGTVYSSQVYETENNKGGIVEFEKDFDGTGYDATELYYGSLLLGTTQGDLACDYGDYPPLSTYIPLGPPVCDSFFVDGEAGTYKIEQCTYQFAPWSHPDLIITKYAFGFWVPTGGTEDCEQVVEDVYVLYNAGVDDIDSLEKGVWLDYDVEPDYNDLSDGNQQYQSKWMWNPADPTRVYGLTMKPANAGEVAVTGWGVSQAARVYDGQYMDSLKYWMENIGWADDNPGVAEDRSIMIVGNRFDLPAGAYHIEKFLKWGYHGPIDPGGDANWRTFLYNVLHQEGFYRGDVNKDGKLDVSDVIYTINFLFKGGPMPKEFKNQGDVNCDGNTDISDVIYTINYLFKGGPAPIDKNRFFLESPFVDPAHKAAYISRAPGLFGEPDWKFLGQ
jgi:hypothetical protein